MDGGMALGGGAATAAGRSEACAPLLSVVVPTFRREALLAALLDRLAAQIAAAAEPGAVEMVVVDNAPEGSARDAVARAAGAARYVHEPSPGLANARNRGAAEARGTYVAFIDDDQKPADGWLAACLAAARDGVDAAFGPVEPVFKTEPHPALRRSVLRSFSRRIDAPDRADVTARRAHLGTGNSMFHRGRYLTGPVPFDPRFNATGGEDVWLLREIVERRGARLTWLAGAAVSEAVPAARMTEAYLGARRRRDGALRCVVESGSARLPALRTGLWMAVGVAQWALCSAAAAAARAVGDERAAWFAIEAQSGAGKALWRREQAGGAQAGGAAFARAGAPLIAYLTGEYPRVSHTFIQREVAALRRHGLGIATCAVRETPPAELTGPEEREAAATTFYVLAAAKRPLRLAADHLGAFARAPRRYLTALALALRTSPPGAKALVWQLFYLAEAGVLAGRLRRAGATHIHNHFADSSCTVAMLAAAMTGLPFSFSMHGPTEFFAVERWRLDEKIARAAFVACISHFCRSQLMMLSEPEHWAKLRIVHCGVEPARYGTGAGRTGAGRVIFVGRLAAVKGAPVLLEAFGAVRAVHPQATLTLIGDGPLRADLEARAAALDLTGAVSFTGYLSQQAVAERLADADVFVLPSFAEGVPVVLMEAMASGLPGVSTHIAGIPELVEDGASGLLVPPGDADALAAALSALLADPARRARMGAAGQAKVAAEFDIEVESAWLAALFRGYAEGRPPEGLRPRADSGQKDGEKIDSVVKAEEVPIIFRLQATGKTMNAAIGILKLAAFWTLSRLPGPLGAAFETRWWWARRKLKIGASAAAFERTLEALGSDSLCVDLGANVGIVAERMAERAGHVHAFEPDPWSFARLKERLGDRPNVTLHNAAIGGRDGTLTLMRDPGFDGNRAGASQGTSAFTSLLWNHGEPETFEAPVVDIRRFLRGLDRPVDLMKVDIEGAEAELLETLLDAPERLRIRTMFIETHEPQIPALRPRLKALRRRIRSLDRPTIHLDWV